MYKTTSDMSFFIGGELNIEKIRRNNFELAADEIGMSKQLVLKHFDDMANTIERALEEAAEELAINGFDDAINLKDLIVNSGGYSLL